MTIGRMHFRYEYQNATTEYIFQEFETILRTKETIYCHLMNCRYLVVYWTRLRYSRIKFHTFFVQLCNHTSRNMCQDNIHGRKFYHDNQLDLVSQDSESKIVIVNFTQTVQSHVTHESIKTLIPCTTGHSITFSRCIFYTKFYFNHPNKYISAH